ncbi:MAG TPA: C1 family peptidase [Armatimonadaceae bacterium]|nr:C1 family peptidase [Armatimonadaceae bacterium]
MKTNELEGGAGIDASALSAFRAAFAADPRNRFALNAVTKTSVRTVALNRDAVVRHNHTFSHMVKAGAATSQNSSGRCWMFAGLNLFRMAAAQKMNLEDFELSQSYLFFWDKLERANYFLENVLATLEEPTDSRLMAHLVSQPVQDGGQWDMFVNLVRKYGVVPKEAMPETESSSASGVLNAMVTLKLREFAARLRQASQKGASPDALRGRKEEMLEEVYRMLAIHLGEPPTEFAWQWRDKDKEFHREGVITPQAFYEKFVGIELDDYLCLIHCPMDTTPYNELYTVQYLGNVVGGHVVRYVNVPIGVLKKAAVAQVAAGESVWFGCDVGKHFDRDLGLMDLDLFDYGGIYGTTFSLNKAERLDYGHSQMTHAMVFTGVDLDDDGKPRKWRVENSWGDKGGDKGFMVMTDPWFDEYNYEVVVRKEHVPAEVVALLDTTPTVLAPWHPMGALASR